ncbi:MAG TPA: sugar MFS transporter [Burkholderiaceae bacterium]
MGTKQASPRVALTVVTAMFFMWGFITSLNDVLIPHLKAVFSLNYAQSMLVQFTFFGAYFVVSLPAGKVVAHFGYRTSIVMGLAVCGIGALLFYPAALLPSYPVFLLAFFTLASGITLLQVAANAYVSLLGEPRQAASRLNLAQAFNSLGTTLAPMFGGALILSGVEAAVAAMEKLPVAEQAAIRLQQAQMVQGPYIGLALALFALAAIVFAFHLPAVAAAEGAEADRLSFGEALRHRHLRLGVIAIFLYVGAEVSIGSFLINYIAEPHIGNLTVAAAAFYVTLYWGGAMVGRFIGAALLRQADPRKVLGACAVAATLLLAVTMGTDGSIAVWAVVAIGLFNSVMFPNIFTFGIEGMGALTGKASSLLIMAIVGGAVVPLLQGVLADSMGVQLSFVLPLLCYLYIAYYGYRGSRVEGAVQHDGSAAAPAAPH